MGTGDIGDKVFGFPVLIGDIGGTNARFALIVDAFAEPKVFPTIRTADYQSFAEAIQETVLDKTSLQPKSAMFAVAGPVGGEEIALTNNNWTVRPGELATGFELSDVAVLNDFAAQALAVVALDGEHMTKLGGGEPVENASRVVLGPGTGLGVAGLVHAKQVWIPVPGEGGHVDCGPQSESDYAIFPHIEKIGGRVSAEQVLSGRGLINIHHALCAADGKAPRYDEAQTLTQAAIDQNEAAARQAVDTFITTLGRVAGDMALIFMARGGVFLTGGVIQKLAPLLSEELLRPAFENKAPHEDFLSTVPIYAISDPLAALAGLAAYARTPTLFGDTDAIRRWSYNH